MLEQDYLLRILVQFAEAMRRSMQKAAGERNPQEAAEALEVAVGDAADMDGNVLLSLAPESMAGIMQVSGVDPRVTEYIARSLLLESTYLRDANDEDRANLRAAQAHALAEAYGFELSDEQVTEDELEKLFESTIRA